MNTIKKICTLLLLFFIPLWIIAHNGYAVYEHYCMKFSHILNQFIENPTNVSSNDGVYKSLYDLNRYIENAETDTEERQALNQLTPDN